MKQVIIWYLTDNESGNEFAAAIKDLGLNTHIVLDDDFSNENISSDEINIFIVDFKQKNLSDIMSILRSDKRIHNYLKFVMLYKKQMRKAVNMSLNLLHVEFISRSINKKEFVLLLEKSVIVEQYREIMKYISKESEERIETFENLIDINRKDVFDSDSEKATFTKILEYEKNLMEEQERINKTMKMLTLLRQKEIFDVKNRVEAEEMVETLRRKELVESHGVIRAQESLINYTSKELNDANRVLNATERVQEMSRVEAIRLHDDLKTEKEKNQKLKKEIQQLKQKVKALKKRK